MDYRVIAAVAFLVAAAMAPLCALVGTRWGFVDHAGDQLKIHEGAMPVLGGLAVLGGFFVSLAVSGSRMPIAGTAAILIVYAVGTVDDRLPLSPAGRLITQGMAGVLLLGDPVLRDLPPLGWAGALVLALALANAVNLMDGQDGLTGGLVLIAAASLAAIAATTASVGQPVALATAGATGGFLIWNWPRPKIFLGNGGAYALGVLLALLAIRAVVAEGWEGLAAAGLCLSVFAFELTFTVLRRFASGRSLFPGDRLHSYDLLSNVLSSRTATTISFWTAGGVAGLAGLASSRVEPAAVGLVVLVFGAAALAAGWLLWRLIPMSAEGPQT